MGKPYAAKIKDPNGELVSNRSDNRIFSDIMHNALSRRSLLQGSAAVAGAMMLPCAFNNAHAAPTSKAGRAHRLGFQSIATSTADEIRVPEGYTARAFYR